MKDIQIKGSTGYKQLQKLNKEYPEFVIDYIEFDQHVLINMFDPLLFSHNETKIYDTYHGKDFNVGISSAISSYGRIYMSGIMSFVMRNGGSIYYTDTDSIVTDMQLPSYLIGKELGQFKLEHNIKKGVWLAPKVYAIINDKNQTIMKVKGLSDLSASPLTYETLAKCCYYDYDLPPVYHTKL